MKSVFDDQNSTVKSSKKRTAQPELVKLAGRYVAKLRADLDDNSIRALASDKVANPVLQVSAVPYTRTKFGLNDFRVR